MKVHKTLWIVTAILALMLVFVCILIARVQQALPKQPLPIPGVVTESQQPVVVAAKQAAEPLTPEHVWDDSNFNDTGDFTLPETAAMDEEGCIGIVTVPSVGIQLKVYETDDAMEDMKHGAAHFKSTSAWQGNVGLSGHNYKSQFGSLTRVQEGDVITYETAMGVRYYRVSTIAQINDDDWSYLDRTQDNRITLITCVVGKDDQRLMVQGTAF